MENACNTDVIYQNLLEKGLAEFNLPNDWIELAQKSELSKLKDGFYAQNATHVSLFDQCSVINRLQKKIRDKNPTTYNSYFITRVVEGGSSEKYRTHYDSHKYTIVVPLLLPELSTSTGENGQLYIVPNNRRQPVSEIENIIGKTFALRYRSEERYPLVARKAGYLEPKLEVGKALIFAGNVSLHGNKANASNQKRITLIAHFCDPFPNGIGSLLRRARTILGYRK